jgi:hypothetical protein
MLPRRAGFGYEFMERLGRIPGPRQPTAYLAEQLRIMDLDCWRGRQGSSD